MACTSLGSTTVQKLKVSRLPDFSPTVCACQANKYCLNVKTRLKAQTATSVHRKTKTHATANHSKNKQQSSYLLHIAARKKHFTLLNLFHYLIYISVNSHQDYGQAHKADTRQKSRR